MRSHPIDYQDLILLYKYISDKNMKRNQVNKYCGKLISFDQIGEDVFVINTESIELYDIVFMITQGYFRVTLIYDSIFIKSTFNDFSDIVDAIKDHKTKKNIPSEQIDKILDFTMKNKDEIKSITEHLNNLSRKNDH